MGIDFIKHNHLRGHSSRQLAEYYDCEQVHEEG